MQKEKKKKTIGDETRRSKQIFDEHSFDDRPIETTIPQEDSIVNYLFNGLTCTESIFFYSE